MEINKKFNPAKTCKSSMKTTPNYGGDGLTIIKKR